MGESERERGESEGNREERGKREGGEKIGVSEKG
jgi:hypothetical protein